MNRTLAWVVACLFAVGSLLFFFTNLGPLDGVNKQELVTRAQGLQAKIDSGRYQGNKVAIGHILNAKIYLTNILAAKLRVSNCAKLLSLEPTLQSGFYQLFPEIPDGPNTKPVVAWCHVPPTRNTAVTILHSGQGPLPSVLGKVLTQATHEFPEIVSILDGPVNKDTSPSVMNASLNEVLNSEHTVHIKENMLLVAHRAGNLVIAPNVSEIGSAGNVLYAPGNLARLGNDIYTIALAMKYPIDSSEIRSLKDSRTQDCLGVSFSESVAKFARSDCLEEGPDIQFRFLQKPGTNFSIQHVATGKCLEPTDSTAAPLQLATCTASSNQTWSLNLRTMPFVVRSVTKQKCLDFDADGGATMVDCTSKQTVWLDTGANLSVNLRSMSPGQGAWSDWLTIPTGYATPYQAPVVATFSGKTAILAGDSKSLGVFELLSSGNFGVKLRTSYPVEIVRKASMGAAYVDMGDGVVDLIMGVQVAGKLYLSRFNGTFVTPWVEMNQVKIPDGMAMNSYMPLKMVRTGIRKLKIAIPLIEPGGNAYLSTRKFHYIAAELVDDPGTCANFSYAKKYNLTDKAIDSVMKHYEETGKALNACRPFLPDCTIQKYYQRRPDVLAHSKYSKNPIRHFQEIGAKEGMCKPYIPKCNIQTYAKRFQVSTRVNGLYSPLADFHNRVSSSGMDPNTCIPVQSIKCTKEEYLKLRPDVVSSPVFKNDPGLHYAAKGIVAGMCEPSTPSSCEDGENSNELSDGCMTQSVGPRLVTGDLYAASDTKRLIKSCSDQLKVGQLIPACYFDPDSWYPQGWPLNGPLASGFKNSPPDYKWTYLTEDSDGCGNCVAFSSTRVCSAASVGLKMKVDKPGSENNDYVYTCNKFYNYRAGDYSCDGPKQSSFHFADLVSCCGVNSAEKCEPYDVQKNENCWTNSQGTKNCSGTKYTYKVKCICRKAS